MTRDEKIAESRNRRLQILDDVIRKKTVELSDLRKQFGVSNATIQSDVEYLTELIPLLERSRGRLSYIFAISDTYFGDNVRDKKLLPQKQAIALKVLSLVEPNDLLVLGPGSTTYEVMKKLAGHRRFVICSNNLALLQVSGLLSVSVLGGTFTRDVWATTGSEAEAAFDSFLTLHQNQIDKTIIGTSGLTFHDGAVWLFVHNESEKDIVSDFIEATTDVIVVTAEAKLGSPDTTPVMDLVTRVKPEHRVRIITSDIKTSEERKLAIEKFGKKLASVGIDLIIASAK